MRSVRLCCHKDILSPIDRGQTCKAQSSFLRVSRFSSDNLPSRYFRAVHILKHRAEKGKSLRMLRCRLYAVSAAGKSGAECFILQRIPQKNRNIRYGRVMVRVMQSCRISEMRIIHPKFTRFFVDELCKRIRRTCDPVYKCHTAFRTGRKQNAI